MGRQKTRKSKTIAFFVRLAITLAVIFSIGTGGYFLIDKAIVPKYFGKYGINSLSDLVSMMKMIYNVPDEKDFVINPYSTADKTSAINTLKESLPDAVEGNEIDFNKIAKQKMYPAEGKSNIEFTDRQMCAVLDEMLQSGVLATSLENLEYIDTLNISARELVVKPSGGKNEDGYFNCANISLVLKIDTDTARKQMSTQMDVPIFLLDMIMPKTLYVSTTYQVTIDENNVWKASDATITVNGRSEKHSNILLNLLVSFIFPPEDEMTVNKLTDTFCDVLNSGLSLLGDVQFSDSIKTGTKDANGIYIHINQPIEEPPAEEPPVEEPPVEEPPIEE